MPEQVKDHLRKLLTILESDELTPTGRLFVIGEVWDITIGGERDMGARDYVGAA